MEVRQRFNFVNPGQTPVLEGDCPLYARQKRCQFLFPGEVGERQIVCMIGFLHSEMCAQEVGGKLLGGSGWERMFHLVKIFTPGGKHVKRMRDGYLITLVWLELLRQRAYDTYCQSIGPHEPLDKWEQRIYDMSPTAFYWGHIVRKFPSDILQLHSQSAPRELAGHIRVHSDALSIFLRIWSHKLFSMGSSVFARYGSATYTSP